MALGVTKSSSKKTVTILVLLPPVDTEINLMSSLSYQKPCQSLAHPQTFFPKLLARDTQGDEP